VNKLSFGYGFAAWLLCAGCSFSEHKQCAADGDCGKDASCHLGYCVTSDAPAAIGGKGGQRATGTSNSETPGEGGGGGAQTGTTAAQAARA
jgi:hypothetical protein